MPAARRDAAFDELFGPLTGPDARAALEACIGISQVTQVCAILNQKFTVYAHQKDGTSAVDIASDFIGMVDKYHTTLNILERQFSAHRPDVLEKQGKEAKEGKDPHEHIIGNLKIFKDFKENMLVPLLEKVFEAKVCLPLSDMAAAQQQLVREHYISLGSPLPDPLPTSHPVVDAALQGSGQIMSKDWQAIRGRVEAIKEVASTYQLFSKFKETFIPCFMKLGWDKQKFAQKVLDVDADNALTIAVFTLGGSAIVQAANNKDNPSSALTKARKFWSDAGATADLPQIFEDFIDKQV